MSTRRRAAGRSTPCARPTESRCGLRPSERRTSSPARTWHPSTTSASRSEEHTSELQSLRHLVCRLLLEKKNDPADRPAANSTAGRSLHSDAPCPAADREQPADGCASDPADTGTIAAASSGESAAPSQKQ